MPAPGVGSTLGAGAYVLSGEVAKTKAGPSIVLSFFIAAIVSVLAGLCYAEFGARVPKTGSAYVYSYITVGELIAFIIGWNLVLEYAIGTASVARAWTANFNTLVDYKISNFLNSTMPIHVDFLAEYPDFFALGLVASLTIILAIGVKQSTIFNSVFTVLNLLVLTSVIVCGFFNIDFKNWSIDKSEVPSGYGDGGFMPYGISGMLSGAATCFYGFIGFDCIATTGEEAKNPQKAIPISIIVSLFIVFIFYFLISLVLTTMSPYYLLDASASLPFVFERIGWTIAKYVIAIGGICALTASMVGSIFPLPRIVYAMAEDRIIFGALSQVSDKSKTPVLATVVAGLFAGLTALIFDLTELVDMMSIGTLLAYSFVAKCVVILRLTHYNFLDIYKEKGLFAIALCVVLVNAEDDLTSGWAIYLIIQFIVLIIICMIIIAMQPSNTANIPFKVPFVPFLPEFSAAVNIYLMLKLSPSTWIRFCVWMVIGFFIYFGYGFRKSKLAEQK
ncbi:cationic amino acid transporter 2 [Octopus bimaculoides]|nr:cationic amino acid transporter 2 [Octopus bimaculoides]